MYTSFSQLAKYKIKRDKRIMDNTLNRLKALSDRNRLRIVVALENGRELCACQLIELLQLKGGTVSRHLSILSQSDLIESRKDGRWIYYSLSEHFKNTSLFHSILAEVKGSDEYKNDKKQINKIAGCSKEELCRSQRGER